MIIARGPETEREHSKALDMLIDLEKVVPSSLREIDKSDYADTLLKDWARIETEARSRKRDKPTDDEIARAQEAAHYLVGENRAVKLLGDLSGEVNGELARCRDLRLRKFKITEQGATRLVDEDEARVVVAKQVLERKRDRLEERALALQTKVATAPTTFTTEDAAEHYTACMFLVEAMDIIEAVETGATRTIGRKVSELRGKRDDLNGIDDTDVKATLSRIRQQGLLPSAEQFSDLVAEREIERGLRELGTTLPGRMVADYIKRAARETSGKILAPHELLPTGGLNLEQIVGNEVAQTLGKRAETVLDRAYQDLTVNCDKFEQLVAHVEEKLPVLESGRKTTFTREISDWQLLARSRWYLQKTVPELLSVNAPAMTKGDPRDKELLAKIPTPHQFNELLGDIRIRTAVVTNYPKLRSGELAVGEKGEIYRVSQDGKKTILAAALSLEDRVAVEILNSMGVHPDPFSENPQTRTAWNGIFKGTHDSIRQLYPWDKNNRSAGLFAEATGLSREAVDKRKFTLIIEDPRHPGTYFLGDQFQISGLEPAELIDEWEGLKGPAYFWNIIRKGVETGRGWGTLFEKGMLIPKDVTLELASGKYDYIPASANDVRDEILGRLYRLADETMYRSLEITARTKGELPKANILAEVQENGLGLASFFEFSGLYVTGVAGKGNVRNQIEAMVNAYKDNNRAASDEEVNAYILRKTGIDPAGRIPESYSEWRDVVSENLGQLLRKEGFSGTVDDFLVRVRKIGLAEYHFRDATARRLAELIVNDPIAKIVIKLLVLTQEKCHHDKLDWLMRQEELRVSGVTTSEEEIDKFQMGVDEALKNENLTPVQHEELLERLVKLRKGETFINKLRTVDGWVFQRWASVFTIPIKVIGEMITLTKWDTDRSKFYESARKYFGVSPAGAAVAIPIFLTMMTIESLAAGTLATGMAWPLFMQASLYGVGVTNALHFLNEKVIRLTRVPYDRYLYRPRRKSR